MKRILITGGSGLLGTALKDVLPEIASKDLATFYPTRSHLNLLDKTDVDFCFQNFNPTYVIHLAGKVGGVKGNTTYVSDFFRENMEMNMNVLEASKNCGAKLLSILSTCVYPDAEYVTYPLTEEQLHLGPPHESNFGYAYAKRMLDVQSRAYRQQFKMNFITVVPNNLYGINDNFDLENGHVIPALIRKIWEAKLTDSPQVEIWGSHDTRREFTYADDVAKILMNVLDSYNESEPINIGNTQDISIGEITNILKIFLNYKGEFYFNDNKPIGQTKKPSSNKKLLKLRLWNMEYYTDISVGLKKTCNWFMKNYPVIRGT